MARKSLHEKIFQKSPAERTVGEVALTTGDFSMLPEYKEGGSMHIKLNPKHKGFCTPISKSTCTGKRKQFALNARKWNKKADGGDIKPRKVTTVPEGYLPIADRPNYFRKTMSQSLGMAQGTGAGGSQYESFLQSQLGNGISPEELVVKKYIGADVVGKYKQYYKPTEDIVYTEPTSIPNTPTQAQRRQPVYGPDKHIRGEMFYPSRNSTGITDGGTLNTSAQSGRLKFRNDFGFSGEEVDVNGKDIQKYLGTTHTFGSEDLYNGLKSKAMNVTKMADGGNISKKKLLQSKSNIVPQYNMGSFYDFNNVEPDYGHFGPSNEDSTLYKNSFYNPPLSVEQAEAKRQAILFNPKNDESRNDFKKANIILNAIKDNNSQTKKMADGGVIQNGKFNGDAAGQAGLSVLPNALTLFDPNAGESTKDAGIGGVVGGIGGSFFGPVGTAIGSQIGSFIGGSIGKHKEEGVRRSRFDGTQTRLNSKLNLDYNANPYGDNNSFYAEEGGQPGEQPEAATQQPAVTKVNIEKKELAVNPDNLEIERKFSNKNRFAKHAKNVFSEPVGNHVELPDNLIIIPKKLADTYEKGSNITRKSMLAQLLKDQVNREHAEGLEGKMANGGGVPLMSAQNKLPMYDPSGGFDQIPDYLQPGINQPIDNNVTVTGYAHAPKGFDYGTGQVVGQHNQLDFNPDLTTHDRNLKLPHVSAVGAAEALNLVPTLYGLGNAFGSDPYLKYNENNGFAGAQSDIEQIPTDVNMEGAKAAMFKVARQNNQMLGNVNSPSIRAEQAANMTKVIDSTGQLYANADNQRKDRIASKLGQLAGLKVQQGANQEQARERYSTELRMDKANREGLIQHGLSEGVTNLSKMIMDKERIRSLNTMSKYFKLDPTGKKLLEENPDAVQHMIEQLHGGYMPNFNVLDSKDKSTTTVERDANNRVKKTTQTTKSK
jgi:hypothetical protein